MSNLALIQPQVANFHTCQVTDWLDGLPVIAQPAAGGVVAGSANVGVGSLAVAAVDVSAELGVHVATVTRIAGGFSAFTVTDPDGDITGRGVVGLQLYAGGITLTLAQAAGQAALAVGDTFAIAVVPAPIDLTGLRFDLDARVSVAAAGIALAASSVAAVPTIVSGGASGALAMQVAQATMAALPPSAPNYPYNIYATDPTTGRRVVAFYGVIVHAALLQAS